MTLFKAYLKIRDFPMSNHKIAMQILKLALQVKNGNPDATPTEYKQHMQGFSPLLVDYVAMLSIRNTIKG